VQQAEAAIEKLVSESQHEVSINLASQNAAYNSSTKEK